MIEIWGRPTSGCTQRVLWAIEEAGVPYELTLASAIMGPEGHISKGGKPYGVVDTPDYLAMNPNGTVPTIDDNGFVLWESNAIVEYIGLKYAPSLYGDDFSTFARASSWMSWANGHLDPPMTVLVLHVVRLAQRLRDPSVVAGGAEGMNKQVKTLDDALSKTPFLAGDSFTMADISTAPAVYRWMMYDLDRPRFRHVEAWQARLAQRPAFQKHIAPREYHMI